MCTPCVATSKIKIKNSLNFPLGKKTISALSEDLDLPNVEEREFSAQISNVERERGRKE